jgi:hypothetical protein
MNSIRKRANLVGVDSLKKLPGDGSTINVFPRGGGMEEDEESPSPLSVYE